MMNITAHGQLRWHHISAIVGSLVWLLLLLFLPAEPQTLGLITHLLLLAVLVFVPLGLGLATTDRLGRYAVFHRLVVRVQPIVALVAAGAFLLPAGAFAGMLALFWLLFGGIVALLSLARLLDRSLRAAPELCIVMGQLLLLVGGFWLAMTRFGARPLGFGDTIVLLTAVHFHYAGFALTITQMVVLHGVVNACGLVLCGLLAWTLELWE